MALLKGLKWALRSMGPKWVAREIARRIIGKPYTYNGILVKDDATFRLIRILASKGSVWGQGDTVFSAMSWASSPYRLKTYSIFARLQMRTSR